MKSNRFSLLPLLAVAAVVVPAFAADVEIVLPSGANAVERTAAQELAEHWKKVTDGTAETVTAATGKARWTFRLGRAAQLGLEGLGKNCAKVRISGDGIVDIAGVDGDAAMKENTSAGTLFGVYGFLERKLGVRWLWPGELGTVCPKRREISLAAEEWTERHMAFAVWRASANIKSPGWKDKAAARKFYSDQSLWLRRHRFAACDRLAKGHAFTSWFKEYGKTHPEWFNEMPDGTRRGDPFYFGGRADIISLCASNRELVREIVRRWAEKDPTDIINGNENDTAGKCCCPNCLAADATGDDAGRLARAAAAFSAKSNGWWRALGSESTRYAAFWRAILEEGRKVRPDCRVIGCVYANYSDPPAQGTKLDASVILRFCPPVMYPWTDEKVKYFKDCWQGWSATGAKLMMRPNFTLDGHNFPLAYYRRYADCYDFVRAHGLVAVDMDSLTGVYGANGLTTYVIASKNSSPERPLAALEDDYFSAFGSSAAVMRECYAQFEKASEAGFGKADPDDTIEGGRYCDFMLSAYRVFPPAMLEGACARLSAAMAAEKDPLVVRRLAFVKTGLEDALLVLKSQRGFAEYQKTRDRTLFSSAYAELLAFRRRNEGLGYQNFATVDFYESRHWPRHLGLLGSSARELDGWELNLNPDPAVGSWVPQKKLHQWRADYNGIGWYRCRFTLSADEAQRFNRLVFGAVDGLPTVHLNGKVVQDGHPIPEPGLAWRTPFTVENVDAFKAGENELLIKIDKKVPGRRGINRPVYLDCRPGPPAQKSDFHIFVLAGQSNMSGRGALTATNRVPHDRVLVMSKDGTWREAVEPFHWEKPRACGAGLAASFARAYADAHPGVTVGLVPVAYGGSPISAWQPGKVHYTNALHYAKLALKDGVVKGFLWHQGESDAFKTGSVAAYLPKFTNAITRLRRELGAENVPFLAGELGPYLKDWYEKRRPNMYWKEMNAEIAKGVALMPCAALVPSEGLYDVKTDKIHFATPALRAFGLRYWDVFRRLECGRASEAR